MKVLIENNLGDLLASTIKEISLNGTESSPRGLKTYEISPLTLVLTNPKNRFILLNNINYPLIAVKQIYSLAGIIDFDSFDFYEKIFQNQEESAAHIYSDLIYSDIDKQLLHIYKTLSKDIYSRQAIVKIGLTNEPQLINPITISLQFIFRNGKLNMIAYLRSNEIWKGLSTDFHFIIFLQEVIASWLNIEIGTYTHIVGSAHIYENNLTKAKEFLAQSKQYNKIKYFSFQGSREDALSEVMQFIQFDSQIRNGGKIKKYNFVNPYLSFCTEIIKTAFLEYSKKQSI